MARYITALEVSTNYEEEQTLEKNGFTKINVNLNEGTQAANNVFLWFQKGDKLPVTRVQVSFSQEMEVGLEKSQFIKIPKDLNTGTTGEPLYMWYSRTTGSHDVPIVDVNVTVSASSEANRLTARGVWEEVSCNLNLGNGGNFVYAWVKRDKPIYICDITATNTYDQDRNLLSSGYTRVDVNTNLGADGGAEVFIWYRKTTDETNSLSDLNISINQTQYAEIQGESFEVVNINLNENTSGSAVYLWYKKEADLGKVRGMVLLLNKNAVKTYKDAGIKVIERNLNTGNRGEMIYMCYV